MIHFLRSKIEFSIMLLIAFLLQTGNYYKIFIFYAVNLPFEIIAVYFHELSHGIVSLLTGGFTYNIELYFGAGGKCHCASDLNFIVVAAGYLGQSIFGLLIYLGFTKWLRESIHYVIKACIVIVLVTMLFWIRDFQSFVALVLIAYFFAFIGHLKHIREMQLCLKFVAIYLVLSGMIDPYIFYNFSPNNREAWDGIAVARLIGISEIKIVTFWCLVSFACLLYIWVAESHGYFRKILVEVQNELKNKDNLKKQKKNEHKPSRKKNT